MIGEFVDVMGRVMVNVWCKALMKLDGSRPTMGFSRNFEHDRKSIVMLFSVFRRVRMTKIAINWFAKRSRPAVSLFTIPPPSPRSPAPNPQSTPEPLVFSFSVLPFLLLLQDFITLVHSSPTEGEQLPKIIY